VTRTAADPAAAVATYLESVPSVMSLIVPSVVYRPKLPTSGLPQAMPFACIVLTRNGGYAKFGGTTLPWRDPRVEARCYGSTLLEADQLAGEVAKALGALRQSVWHETTGGLKVRLVHARIEAGPIPLFDPDTDWPYAFLSAQVTITEQVLA
jgi:hypothetical protein